MQATLTGFHQWLKSAKPLDFKECDYFDDGNGSINKNFHYDYNLWFAYNSNRYRKNPVTFFSKGYIINERLDLIEAYRCYLIGLGFDKPRHLESEEN